MSVKNVAAHIGLFALAWFATVNRVLFLLLKRCVLLLLDRAAPRHSSRYAELRQYPELHREVENNESDEPDHTVHGFLPSLSN